VSIGQCLFKATVSMNSLADNPMETISKILSTKCGRDRLSGLEVILFDVDGTVLDRDSAHRRYIERLVYKFPEAVAASTDHHDVIQKLIMDDDRGRKDRNEYAQFVIAQLPNLSWTPEQFLSDYFLNIGQLVEKQEWVIALLKQLRKIFRIGAVTNGGSNNQRTKLKTAGLQSSFDYILISEEVGIQKPNPEIFKMALNALKAEPTCALHVGDDPVNDVIGSKGAGVMACWVSQGLTYPKHLEKPDLYIESIADLRTLLDL
jgi:putative hydrolase of the HAD superfamily